MLVTNTTRQQLFSTMKHNKNFPRNIATSYKDFISDNHNQENRAGFQILRRF